MSDRRAGLIAVLAALPGGDRIGEGRRAEWAMVIEAAAGFGAIGELPRAKQVSSARAQAELDKYARLCRELALHALAMSRTSLGAIEAEQGGALHPLILADEAAKACGAVATLKPLTHQPTRAGARAKVAADWVTRAATDAYREITGREPTITVKDGKGGGPFLAYLASIFKALSIKASPEAQARKFMEKSRPESDT